MRYRPEHNEATRERILAAASRLYREQGVAGVGLAKVMAEVDLTVGTFYTHFDSKEALLSEALCRSLDERDAELEQLHGVGALEAAVRTYLSPEHRDGAATGCPLAALAAEVARHSVETREALVLHLAPSLDRLAEWLAHSRGQSVSRAEATAFFGLLVGTLQLARATSDRVASDAILEAGVRAALTLAS